MINVFLLQRSLNAPVQVDDKIFKLARGLPGQRTAVSQWFQLFARHLSRVWSGTSFHATDFDVHPEPPVPIVRVDELFTVWEEKTK